MANIDGITFKQTLVPLQDAAIDEDSGDEGEENVDEEEGEMEE